MPLSGNRLHQKITIAPPLSAIVIIISSLFLRLLSAFLSGLVRLALLFGGLSSERSF